MKYVYTLFAIFYAGALALYCAEAAPAALASEILADPASALAANQAQAQGLLETALANPWVSWGLGAAVILLGISRKVAPGLWGMAANAAYHLVATVQDRESKKRTAAIADVGSVIVESIEDLDDDSTIGNLKETLFQKIGVDEKLEGAIQEVVASHKTKRNTHQEANG